MVYPEESNRVIKEIELALKEKKKNIVITNCHAFEIKLIKIFKNRGGLRKFEVIKDSRCFIKGSSVYIVFAYKNNLPIIRNIQSMKFNGKFTCWTYLKLKDEVKKLPKGSFYIIKILHKVLTHSSYLRNLDVKREQIDSINSKIISDEIRQDLKNQLNTVYVMYKIDMKY